jgi:hypothetical protein
MALRAFLGVLLIAFLTLSPANGAEPPPATVEPLKSGDLSGFRSPGKWQIVGDAANDPKNDKFLFTTPGTGVMFNTNKTTTNIETKDEFGDCEIHIEFVVPKESNSGVYLMGRYEIQVFDSFGVQHPKYSDCGGIYQRWRETPQPGQPQGYKGKPPKVNASLPPGQWQSLDITFRAPRFDSSGKKTENARFVKVVHNGKVIQENEEVTGPTRSGSFADEKPTGPIMLQGNHGPVAFRNIRITPLAAATAK